ncbi:hypothetical protein GVO57_06295 [Sphingomonas changnyeongensis]|uniref:Uncharacterized protein n=1 Tax=Sphingomonas changnyeongensis TaxID=2698679 RepID=A0A7Z2S5M3_9SPHN|nr:hypothetical protein [Sphingomonas changnyeongensis]QHL90523.1 hypothetical protein GVO57_06295 [Sphingomonas changnyeongensis]
MLGNLANCVADPDDVCLAICAFAGRTVDLEGCSKVSEPDQARDLAADAKPLGQPSCDFARRCIVLRADIGIRVPSRWPILRKKRGCLSLGASSSLYRAQMSLSARSKPSSSA